MIMRGLRSAQAFRLLAVLLAMQFMVACQTGIRTDAIRDITQRVIERHDAYVNGDQNLDDATKNGQLNASATLNALVSTAGKYIDGVVLEGPFTPVAARHDTYVSADVSVGPLAKTTFLRSTALVRKAIIESKQKPQPPGS